MTLLITIIAAVICTAIWYRRAPQDDMKVSILCWMYWGASLMWLVDAVFEYAELKSACFTPSMADMMNGSFLGLCVVALGLVIWIITVLIKDPRGVMHDALLHKGTSSSRQESH
jgi:hypothetical protein